MNEQATKQLRPFHETIVDAINQTSSLQELKCLGKLIEATKIPKGYEEILMAFMGRAFDLRDDFLKENVNVVAGVQSSISAQDKQAAEAETAKKA